ncbi:unnamed protein product [Closterium sp. Naga37s-1]|nr:unnamed protein product [Closterium sp. Naga37s-1]
MGAAAGESVAGSGARESTAPAVAGKGAAGAAVREETAEATVAIARPLGVAGAAARVVEATAGPVGAVSGSKGPAGGAGPGDIGATGARGAGGVPTKEVPEGGEVIVMGEDAVEDVMHIDAPLAQYLTPDGEADPGPRQPRNEVPPFPPVPDPMLEEGPMEGLEETLRTEPHEGAPISTPHLSAHPPAGSSHPRPHPQGLPLASRGVARALAFFAEPCTPSPTQAAHSCPHTQGSPRAPRGATRALAFLAEPCSPTPKSTQSSPANLLPPPPPGPPPPGATHISEVKASLRPHLSPTRYKDPNHPSRRTSPTLSPNGLPSSHHTPQAAKSHPQGPVEPHGSDDTLEGPTGGATRGRGAGPNFQHRGATSNTPLPLIPPPTATSEPPQTSLEGAGSGDIGAGGVGGVPTRGVLGGGDVIVRDEDAVEDGMHIDGPLAHYLTPDGEADPGPLQPHDEVPPFPHMPDPMMADGPMEGLEENLRTEPLGGAPILTPHPPAHPPPPSPQEHHIPAPTLGGSLRSARRACGHSEGRASHTQPHPCLSPLLAPFLSPKNSTLPPPPSGAPSSITGSSQGHGLLGGAVLTDP